MASEDEILFCMSSHSPALLRVKLMHCNVFNDNTIGIVMAAGAYAGHYLLRVLVFQTPSPMTVTAYKCLPPYLAVDCVPVTSLPSRRHLRSAKSGCFAVTGARTTLGSRNFAFAGAKICHSLPVDLRLLSQSLRTFRHKLKHNLFVSEP